MNWPLILLATAVVMLINALGAYYFKKSSSKISIHPLKLLKNGYFWLGAALYVLGLLAYLGLLRIIPLSVMYPMTSLTYVWIALLSWKLLDEKFTTAKTLGIVSIIIGIVIIALTS